MTSLNTLDVFFVGKNLDAVELPCGKVVCHCRSGNVLSAYSAKVVQYSEVDPLPCSACVLPCFASLFIRPSLSTQIHSSLTYTGL